MGQSSRETDILVRCEEQKEGIYQVNRIAQLHFYKKARPVLDQLLSAMQTEQLLRILLVALPHG